MSRELGIPWQAEHRHVLVLRAQRRQAGLVEVHLGIVVVTILRQHVLSSLHRREISSFIISVWLSFFQEYLLVDDSLQVRHVWTIYPLIELLAEAHLVEAWQP